MDAHGSREPRAPPPRASGWGHGRGCSAPRSPGTRFFWSVPRPAPLERGRRGCKGAGRRCPRPGLGVMVMTRSWGASWGRRAEPGCWHAWTRPSFRAFLRLRREQATHQPQRGFCRGSRPWASWKGRNNDATFLGLAARRRGAFLRAQCKSGSDFRVLHVNRKKDAQPYTQEEIPGPGDQEGGRVLETGPPPSQRPASAHGTPASWWAPSPRSLGPPRSPPSPLTRMLDAPSVV